MAPGLWGAGCTGAGIATAFPALLSSPAARQPHWAAGSGSRAGPAPVPIRTSGADGDEARLPAPARGTGHPGLRAQPAPREPGRRSGSGPPGLWGTTGRPRRRQHSRRGEPSPSLLEKVWTELRGQGSPPSPAHPPPVVLPGHPHARAAGSRVRAAPPPLPDRFIALKKESSGPPLPAPRPPPRLGLM